MREPSRGHEAQENNGARWLLVLLQALEISVVVFLRRRFGERYFRWRPLVVPVLVLMFGSNFPEHDPAPLLYFLGLWLWFYCVVRHDMAERHRRGDFEHSTYAGYPNLMRARWAQRLGERMVKLKVEPLLVTAIGAGLLEVSRPLGLYLMASGLAMIITMQLTLMAERESELDLRDAQIRQRGLAARVRRDGWRR